MSESKIAANPEDTFVGIGTKLRRMLGFRTRKDEKKGLDTSNDRKPVFSSLQAEGEIAGAGKDGASDTSAQGETRFVSTIWRLGRQDSGIGQNQAEAEAVLTSKVDLDWIDRRSRAQAAIHDKDARLVSVNANKARLEKSVEALKLERWHLTGQPHLPPNRGLSPMAILYVVVGLLAFGAEFPLSVNLIDQGLRLTTTQLSSVNDQAMWALALVLCIFGLAVKIWFDSAADALANRPHPQGQNNETDGKNRVIRHRPWGKLLFLCVNCFLLFCCARATLSIAQLRTDLANESRIVTRIKAERADDGQLTPTQNDELKRAIDHRQESGGKTMVWLTITLPLFGAVSWITGATKFKQSKEDRAAYRSLMNAEKELADCSAEAGILEHEIKAAQERLKEEEEDGTTKAALLKTRIDVYRHGYSRGRILPEEKVEGSFYDFHVNALRRSAQRKVRSYALETIQND